MPFTGAFLFVLCPRCRGAIYLSSAKRVPTPPEAAALPQTLPPADAFALFNDSDEPPPHIVQRLARAGTTTGAGVALFLLATNLVALVVGVPIALAYALNNPTGFVAIYIAFPFPTVIVMLGGPAAAAWYLVLVAAIALSAFVFLRAHLPGAWALLMRVFEGRGSPTLSEPNGLFALARLVSISIVVAVAVGAVASAVGATPNVPAVITSEPFGAALIGLAHASVFEELVTRVLLLGLPLLLIHYVGRGRLESPSSRYVLGGGFALDGPALCFLVFQAAVFGAAHVPGWDLWKFPSTFITGLALGYLFLRYGLAASIVFHFLNDYLYATIVFTSQTSFPILVIAGFYILMAVGVANAGRYVFVVRECILLGRIPEHLGGPGPTHEPEDAAEIAPATPPAPTAVEAPPAKPPP